MAEVTGDLTVRIERATVETKGLRIACPPDMAHHVAAILDGEYDLPVEGVSTVLDIGANVGAFSLWATRRWPGCHVTAYEPQAVCHEALVRSAEANEVARRVSAHKAAVVCDRKDTPAVRLYLGKNNIGEASTSGRWHRDEAASALVPSVHVGDLGPCDVLKVDTEGAERAILEGYLLRHHPVGVAYEYHRRDDRDLIEMLMHEHGYQIVGGVYHTVETGTQRWVSTKGK